MAAWTMLLTMLLVDLTIMTATITKYDDDRKYVDDNDEANCEDDVVGSAKYDADDYNVRIV